MKVDVVEQKNTNDTRKNLLKKIKHKRKVMKLKRQSKHVKQQIVKKVQDKVGDVSKEVDSLNLSSDLQAQLIAELAK
tara:strand:- start:190 stop:420 length:231 start_codon:yes stop_codon:yes gene_type:complete